MLAVQLVQVAALVVVVNLVVSLAVVALEVRDILAAVALVELTKTAVKMVQVAAVAVVLAVEIPLAVLAAAAWAYWVKAATAQAAQLFAGLPVLRAAAVHLVQVDQVRLVARMVLAAREQAQVLALAQALLVQFASFGPVIPVNSHQLVQATNHEVIY
jgi:hypothetical protein